MNIILKTRLKIHEQDYWDENSTTISRIHKLHTLTFPHKTKTEVKNRGKKEKEYRHRKILVVYNKNHFCPIHHWTILHETNVMWIERHEWGLWKLFMIHLSTKIEVEGKLINKTKCKVQLIPFYW
jgi:hypothetical protein